MPYDWLGISSAAISSGPISGTIAVGVAVPTTNITLAALTPTVFTGASVTVPAADITLAALAPTVSTGALVTVPAAVFTIIGFAPTVAIGVAIAAPTGTIAVLAVPPSFVGKVVYPQAINMSVSYAQAVVNSGTSYIHIRGKLGIFGPVP